jgi:hypothetical protein
MNKLVINTQYLENYGTQEDPYMKFKGGNTFVLPNCGELDSNEIATVVARVRPFITTTLAESNGGCDEWSNSSYDCSNFVRVQLSTVRKYKGITTLELHVRVLLSTVVL